MRTGWFYLICIAVSALPARCQLVLSYGPRGVEQVTYAGVQVMNLPSDSAAALHIWHMRATDLNGHPRREGQYGWGETNQGRTWDFPTKTWTYTFAWGSIRVQYVQHGDSLDVAVTESNSAQSGVLFYGATTYPLGLRVAAPVSGIGFSDGVSQPSVTMASWQTAVLAVVVPDARSEVWSGFEQHDGQLATFVSDTRPDSAPNSDNRKEEPLRPGQSRVIRLSLRFSRPGCPAAALAKDALESFAARWPAGRVWEDRRIIGTAFLASSPQGDKTVQGGYPRNPRRYFNDAALDIDERRSFQGRVLQQAEAIVRNLRRLNAQAAITWDIEGEEYPQDTSYACAPDQVSELAPEMERTVETGRYAGSRLDDAYFKIIGTAGFRVGVCVRPQHFVVTKDGHAHQETLPQEKVAAELIRKMRFAHDRWGATIFYLDSTVNADGSTLAPGVLDEAAKALPDSLLIPEESSLRMYRDTAPFQSFLFHGETETTRDVLAVYPHGFSVNLVNDADSVKLSASRERLVQAVRQGDILMVHADSWNANNDTVTGIYREAAQPSSER